MNNAYNGNPAFKARMVASAKNHRELDHYRAGFYSNQRGDEAFKACAIGCALTDVIGRRELIYTLDNTRCGTQDQGEVLRELLSSKLDVPVIFCIIQEAVFEALAGCVGSEVKASDWPVNVLEALQVGDDLAWLDEVVQGMSESYLGNYDALHRDVAIMQCALADDEISKFADEFLEKLRTKGASATTGCEKEEHF